MKLSQRRSLLPLFTAVFLTTLTLNCSGLRSTDAERNPATEADTTAHLSRRALLNPYTRPSWAKDGIPVAFFDADSTLRISKAGSLSANSVDDVSILPGVGAVLQKLAKDGFYIHIVSNQGGVAQGIITEDVAAGALATTVKLIQKDGGLVHSFDYAEKMDDDRKPKTGMALKLDAALKTQYGVGVDKAHSFMVGDSAYKAPDIKPDGTVGAHFSNSDRLFAQNLGVEFFEPTDFFGWRRFGVDVFSKLDQVDEYLKKSEGLRDKDFPLLWKPLLGDTEDTFSLPDPKSSARPLPSPAP